MFSKYRVTKVASILTSVMLFVLLWGAIAMVGWDGSSSDGTTDPAAVAVPEQAAPAPTPAPAPQVTIKRVVVVRRIHESGGGASAVAPPPSAPPPPPVRAPPPPPPPPHTP